MIIETLSTFPDMYESVMGASMMRIAQEKGILEFRAHDLRDWTHDRHRTTDDDPYGGGTPVALVPAARPDVCIIMCTGPTNWGIYSSSGISGTRTSSCAARNT